MADDFRSAPFHLDTDAIAWIETRLAAMTPRQKLGHLINHLMRDGSEKSIAEVLEYQPGSITRHTLGDKAEATQVLARLNAALPVPLLVSADLEGSFMAPPGTSVMPNPLGMAAVDDETATRQAVTIMATQAAAYGINWSFTPQIDINAAFRSAITATRGFGDDPDRIRRHGIAMVQALQAAGTAACVKHWPGEGYDDRDQHLVTTINPLDMTRWEETFGALYRGMIDAGVMTVMSAHIAFPAFIDTIPAASTDRLQPASINRWLNEDLLRSQLGFRGLIVSDASGMAGLSTVSHRRDHVAEIVASGCDIILFSNDLGADIGWLEEALAEGRLTWARVDQAVRRQLALKAALGLHRDRAETPARDRAAEDAFAHGFRARVPTLVHDAAGTLPLDRKRHHRVLLVSKGITIPFLPQPLPLSMPDLLRAEGFEVTEHVWGTPVDPAGHDLLLYVMADETLLTRSSIFVDWREMTGSFHAAMDRPWHDVPVMMVSLGYPYHLYDAPSMPCYVNAYSATPEMQATVVDALVGRAPFAGHSPVDPYCGLPSVFKPVG